MKETVVGTMTMTTTWTTSMSRSPTDFLNARELMGRAATQGGGWQAVLRLSEQTKYPVQWFQFRPTGNHWVRLTLFPSGRWENVGERTKYETRRIIQAPVLYLIEMHLHEGHIVALVAAYELDPLELLAEIPGSES